MWFVWSTEAICVFHYSNRIILTKLVHKNRASILFLSFKVLQCTSMQEAATHRTRLCLGLGVTHVDKYGLAFLGSAGAPIYKATFWIIKIEVKDHQSHLFGCKYIYRQNADFIYDLSLACVFLQSEKKINLISWLFWQFFENSQSCKSRVLLPKLPAYYGNTDCGVFNWGVQN